MPDAPEQGQRPQDWAGTILVVVIFLAIVVLTWASHAITWAVEQVLIVLDLALPPWVWPAITAALGLLYLLPLAPLALTWANKRYRAIFRSWALAAGFMVIASPIRLLQSIDVQLANAGQLIVALPLAALAARFIIRSRGRLAAPAGQNLRWALFASALLCYPWLAFGALGSPLDTLLNLVAGLLFGFLAAVLIQFTIMRSLGEHSRGVGWDIALGGLAASAVLLMMIGSYGLTGVHLLLMAILPALGWATATLGCLRRGEESWLSLSLLIGLVAAVPAVLTDPDELMLLLTLGTRDVLVWATVATVLSVVVAWALSALLILVRSASVAPRRLWAASFAVVAAWLAAGLVYGLIGQPGFHGEGLYVIFKEQAQLDGAVEIDDLQARRRYVYDELVSQANRSQRDIRLALDRVGIDYRPYYLVNAMVIDGGPFVRAWLTTRNEVDRVLTHPVLRPLPAAPPPNRGNAPPPTGTLWNLTMIGVNRVWEELGVTGEGVVVGQSDTGAQFDHPELIQNYRGRNVGHEYHWFDPWYGSGQPYDDNGHGTHTLATAVGASTGVAPGAEWFACSNLARTLGNAGFYLDCLQFMLAPFPPGGNPLHDGDPTLAADVLNNSWGCPAIEGCDAGALRDAARALRHAGIFVVASAGNSGPRCSSVSDPLAIYDEVLTVGAVNRQGTLTEFSSRGPVTVDGSGLVKPDVVAPGEAVISAFPNSTYEPLPGTSMAGPHVAGVVALMWSANPDLKGNIDVTERLLQVTASPYSGPLPQCGAESADDFPNNGAGYGLVDAFAAVSAALEER